MKGFPFFGSSFFFGHDNTLLSLALIRDFFNNGGKTVSPHNLFFRSSFFFSASFS